MQSRIIMLALLVVAGCGGQIEDDGASGASGGGTTPAAPSPSASPSASSSSSSSSGSGTGAACPASGYPSGTVTAASAPDASRLLVGRWTYCSGGDPRVLVDTAATMIEIDPDRTWALLSRDRTGALRESPDEIAHGVLDVTDETSFTMTRADGPSFDDWARFDANGNVMVVGRWAWGSSFAVFVRTTS